MAGKVIVGEQRCDKAGTRFDADVPIRIKQPEHPFVSRGGVKLAGALEHFHIQVQDRIALDVGASTGGFTDCLLQRGAKRVYALDVGRAQLHQRLLVDERVVSMERCNVRYLKPDDLPEQASLAVFDLSFISLNLVMAPVLACLQDQADLVLLVKPQFEVGRERVGKGGIVRDPVAREQAVEAIAAHARSLGLEVRGRMPSPIRGADGNQEFLLHCQTKTTLENDP
jgi:23S rRNA (cytidine1920-2'-O)/16S rRNA (cytidine1409-2'-O)-methyltransferase